MRIRLLHAAYFALSVAVLSLPHALSLASTWHIAGDVASLLSLLAASLTPSPGQSDAIAALTAKVEALTKTLGARGLVILLLGGAALAAAALGTSACTPSSSSVPSAADVTAYGVSEIACVEDYDARAPVDACRAAVSSAFFARFPSLAPDAGPAEGGGQ